MRMLGDIIVDGPPPLPARRPRRPKGPHRAAELDCQTAIVDAAMLAGWRVVAHLPAVTNKGRRTLIQGHPGFPDLFLVRGPIVAAVELKRSPNSVEVDQHAWLRPLAMAFRVADPARLHVCVVWVPEQQQAFIDQLTSRRPDFTPFAYEAPGT